MKIEFEDKIILTDQEKNNFTPIFINACRDFKKEPENVGVHIDRLLDDISNILRARNFEPNRSNRIKPDDKGDNPDGTINVKV